MIWKICKVYAADFSESPQLFLGSWGWLGGGGGGWGWGVGGWWGAAAPAVDTAE
jgi:hypothetical protein